jgi:hypothetical protein
MWRGGVGAAYLFPALSSAGASLAEPALRFHIALIELDGRISRIQLSEKTHAFAHRKRGVRSITSHWHVRRIKELRISAKSEDLGEQT